VRPLRSKFHQHAVAGGLDEAAVCSAMAGSTISRREAFNAASVSNLIAPIT